MSDNKLVLYKQLDKIMTDNLFPNAKRLYTLAKRNDSTITMKQIEAYLSNQKAYQVTKERKVTKKGMGHVVSFSPWSLVQMDLLDMQKYSYDYSQYKSLKKLKGVTTEFNKGYKYILIIIDVFTRYVDCVMLKSKNIDDCIHALDIMLDFNKIKPEIIMSDSESAFLSQKFQDYLSSKNIIHDIVVINDHKSLSVLDRFCRTLRSMLTRLFIGRGNTEWVNDLSALILQYNTSEHRGILNFTPEQVLNNPKVQQLIVQYNHEKNKKNIKLRDDDVYEVGDSVRVFIQKKFKKGTDPSYTNELFKITGRSGKNYTLSNGKTYVKNDLQKVNDIVVEDEEEEENAIVVASKQNKIAKKLKKENLVRPTEEQLNEKRPSREKKVDYKKLNKGL
jgi:hypothetical protein